MMNAVMLNTIFSKMKKRIGDFILGVIIGFCVGAVCGGPIGAILGSFFGGYIGFKGY